LIPWRQVESNERAFRTRVEAGLAIGPRSQSLRITVQGRLGLKYGFRRRQLYRDLIIQKVMLLAAALALVVGVLSDKVVSLDNSVGALRAGILAGGVTAQVSAAKLDPRHVTIDLRSTSGPWSAQVLALPGGQAFLVPGTMPALPTGKTFQAWALVGGKYVSLGVLPRASGDVALQLQPGMSSLLVNTEPQGGTAQPTTSPFVSGLVPKTL